jgi:mono/diheme cytochrome c family protein
LIRPDELRDCTRKAVETMMSLLSRRLFRAALPVTDFFSAFMRLVATLVILLFAGTNPVVFAQGAEDDDTEEIEEELDGTLPGAVAVYRDATGVNVERIDTKLQFRWGAASPDVRLDGKRFSATWKAVLFAPVSGRYQFSADLQGHVRVAVDGKVVLQGESAQREWLAADGGEIVLDAGDHELEVAFEKRFDQAGLGIYWSGPRVHYEVLGAAALSHERTQIDDTHEMFLKGQQLARDLRCQACHGDDQTKPVPRAPALDRLAGNLHRDWLVAYLRGESNSGSAQGTHQPLVQIPERETQLLADVLLDVSRDEPRSTDSAPAEGDADRGRDLVLTIGCLACHQWQGLGDSEARWLGGPLDRVAEKRTARFLELWLREPAACNIDHRMPQFDLDATETSDVVAFLLTCRSSEFDPGKHSAELRRSQDATSLATVRDLVAKLRCDACHRLPASMSLNGDEPNSPEPREGVAKPLAEITVDGAQPGCLSESGQRPGQPRYVLDIQQQDALRHYLSAVSARKERSRDVTDELPDHDMLAVRMHELGCTGCHARESRAGIGGWVQRLATQHPEFASRVPALVPPLLDSAGDKLTDEALRQAVTKPEQRRRPWLDVRMPRYAFESAELDQLLEAMIAADRLPLADETPLSGPNAAWALAGARLVTTDGFGCTSCHGIGSYVPDKGALNTRGPVLSNLGDWIRPAWFQRWVRNPLRVVPRVEMPAVELPVPHVLEGDLNAQVNAVWHVLNQPGFEPPAPDALRVVRQSGVPGDGNRAEVLTDILKSQDKTWIKPILLALPNRHNVLLDMESNQLVAWTVGDAARQRNNGKIWFWELSGFPLLQSTTDDSELLFLSDGQLRPPQRQGQARSELDAWRHESGGVTIERRLVLAEAVGQRDAPRVVHVTESIQALDADPASGEAASGFERRIRMKDLESDQQVALRLVSPEDRMNWRYDATRRQLSRRPIGEKDSAPAAVLTVVAPTDGRLTDDGLWLATCQAADRDTMDFCVRYETNVPVDRFPVLQREPVPVSRGEVDAVPGFAGKWWGVNEAWMPTALDFAPDGSVVVGSLKGRVWRMRDADGDGEYDRAEPISDEMAAPYGVACDGDDVDVVVKYGVVRLSGWDKTGRASQSEIIASGWGHTADYHDWAVGLPRDPRGHYWVALPCQQDQRSEAAAHLRGRVVELVPRTATVDDPRRYALREVSAGHRFPMGMARSREGMLLVTDNQGNYNPFNELNVVLEGHRYGFINALEDAAKISVPTTPPAVAIPHPWTRSVNGICFLQGYAAGNSDYEPVFGPLEGQVVGCEYDTRRLIRMSLQQVGATLQGAAYPLSGTASAADRDLLGPVNCVVGPDNALWLAELRDAGWGAGPNIGRLTRLEFLPERLPCGIAEVRAVEGGIHVRWTRPIEPTLSGVVERYRVASYTRISTPKYGGDDVDRRQEEVIGVVCDPDKLGVLIKLQPLRLGFVYELRVNDMPQGFFPSEAHMTVYATK